MPVHGEKADPIEFGRTVFEDHEKINIGAMVSSPHTCGSQDADIGQLVLAGQCDGFFPMLEEDFGGSSV